MVNPAIQTNGLTRLFGALATVQDVTLSVTPGQFSGVTSALPGIEQERRLTLEEIFLTILEADGHRESMQGLSWLA